MTGGSSVKPPPPPAPAPEPVEAPEVTLASKKKRKRVGYESTFMSNTPLANISQEGKRLLGL